MPAEECCRCDKERSPTRPRQEPTRRCQEDTISRRQLRSTCLSMQDRELVPEHNDLELLELLRAGTKQYELKHAAEDQVAERPDQESTPRDQRDGRTTLRSTQAPRTPNRLTHPTPDERLNSSITPRTR